MVHNAKKVAAAPQSKSKYFQQIGIPTTIFNALLKTKGNTLPVGQTSSLPQASEDRLVEYCMYRSHFGFGLDWTSVRSMAKHIGTKIGLADFHATTGWLNGFKKRYTGVISRRKCQIMEFSRSKGMNKKLVDEYSNVLARAYVHIIMNSPNPPSIFEEIKSIVYPVVI